jgi:hypothetical protein
MTDVWDGRSGLSVDTVDPQLLVAPVSVTGFVQK